MAYTVKTEVVEEFIAVASSSANKRKAFVYVFLKSNIASESVINCAAKKKIGRAHV